MCVTAVSKAIPEARQRLIIYRVFHYMKSGNCTYSISICQFYSKQTIRSIMSEYWYFTPSQDINLAPPLKLDILVDIEFILNWQGLLWVKGFYTVVVESESEWIILSKNVQLRSEDSNVAPPLELDVLVHVEEEHEHEVHGHSWENMPHLQVKMNI